MRSKKKEVYAWHFIKPDKRMSYDEKTLIEAGKTYSVDPDKLSLCHYGLHASIKPLDALSFVYWEDAYICRVKLSGKILKEEDKLCAEKRAVLWMAPVDKILHEFACWCAEQALYLFERDYPNDKRPRAAIEAKRKWVKGEITDRELDAARDAARDVAWDAAWDAARDAARDAAWAAAWDAAWAAAWDAAGDAARDAARDAAWDAQNKQLESMLLALAPEVYSEKAKKTKRTKKAKK